MAAKGGRSFMEMLGATTASPIEGKVIKATDSTVDVPKQKHLEAILLFTHLPDFSMAKIVESLQLRSQEQSWVVVLKSLIIFHRLMRDGHERFSQYLVTSATGLNLENFVDASSPDALSMSGFIRTYAAYINTKIANYRSIGFDICHVKAKEYMSRIEGTTLAEVLKNLKMWIGMSDTMLNAVSEESSSAVQMESQGHGAFAVQVKMPPPQLFGNLCIKGAVRLLLKDALRLFVCMNDDIVKILETYFTLPKRDASEALAVYEDFVRICGKLDTFFGKAKHAGLVEDRHLPELNAAPKVLLPAMRDYVENYGAKKRSQDDEVRVQEQMDRLHFESVDLHDESTT